MVDSVQDLNWWRQRENRRKNNLKVLAAMRKKGPAGRTELEKRTGLSTGTVINCLVGLTEEGLVRREPGGRGRYIHVPREAAEMLGRLLRAESVQQSIGLPGPRMAAQDYETAMQALTVKRELPPITEILARMRPEERPVTFKPVKGNVGVSPWEAEALLASVGVERSPLVRALRGG